MTQGSEHQTVADQLVVLSEGQSITFVRELTELPVRSNAVSVYQQLIGGYALRARPGCQWSYEGFSCLARSGRALLGCTITLVKAEKDKPATNSMRLWKVADEWYGTEGPAQKNATALSVPAEAVDIRVTAGTVAQLLNKVTTEAARRSTQSEARAQRAEQELADLRKRLAGFKRLGRLASDLSDDVLKLAAGAHKSGTKKE